MLRPSRLELVGLLIALCLAGALWAVRAGYGEPRGLRAAYFPNVDAIGAPALTPLDGEISSRQLQRAWRGAAPVAFSVTWSGYLLVPRDDTYAFALTSDDAASLAIDRMTIVDQPGRHGPVTDVRRVRLTAGAHPILVTYVQDGGGAVIELQWAEGDERLTAVPSWALSPRRVGTGTFLFWRVIDWSALIALATALAFAVVTAGRAFLALLRDREAPADDIERLDDRAAGSGGVLQGPTTAGAVALVLMFFVVLAVAHTWPMARDPGGLSRNDNGDTVLNEWIVAWVAHQVTSDPWRLFDANIFYPEPNTLAYSESMIVQSLIGAPILWLGGSPVLTYNLLVIGGFALTGFSMCLVMRQWTGSWTAGLVAGCLYSFNAHSLTRIPHLQALHVEFLPPALLVLDRLLRQPTTRRVVSLAGWFVLQALTSVHLFVFSAFALGGAAVVRRELWTGTSRRRVVLALGGALALSALLMLPFLIPYQRVSEAQHFRRSLEVINEHAATAADYLSTASRLHYPLWSHRFFVGTALFPGVLALALAGMAVANGVAMRNPRARMFVAIAVTGVVLSFGPKLPGYSLLYHALPPLQAIRAVVRFGYLGIVGVAGLAGFGVLAVRHWTAPERWPMVAAVLVAIAALESYAAPLGLEPFDGIPSIYRTLADSKAVVVELPFYDSRAASFHAPYMLNSTAHWRPLLNGYSGFQPASFTRYYEALKQFPDARSFAELHDLGVTHVFVHTDRMSAENLEAIRHDPRLELRGTEGSIELFELRRP